MSDKKSVEVKAPEVKQVVSSEMKHEAFGIFLSKDGMRYVAKVSYNPHTGETGKFEKIGPGDDRSTANERFRIEVGNAGLMTGDK